MKQGFQRLALRLLLSFFAVVLLVCPASATEASVTTDMPEEYKAFLESIPEDIKPYLPDGLFSTDIESVGDALQEMSDFSYLCRTLLSMMGLRLGGCAERLASVCGVLLLSSIFARLRTSFRTEGLAQAFSFALRLSSRCRS